MSQPLNADQIYDGYRLIRFLGRGGFGEVWLCQSEAVGDFRAFKWIPTTGSDHLEKEHEALVLYRKAVSQIRSPHLVPIEHINRNQDGLFYIMPLADGEPSELPPTDPAWLPTSLLSLIQARCETPTWFSSPEIHALILPLLGALQTLSDAGLVHRDVKPENILFFGGHPCLGDISLLGADAAHITRRGTPGYSSPSWYQEGLPDMYAAAVTLYTLLTGNPPDKMGRAAFTWPPQGEDSLSESERAEWRRLHAVIRRATEEKVGERFVDFRTMAAAISGTGEPVTPPITPVGKRRRSFAGVMALVFGILIVAVSLILANRGGSKQSPSAQEPPTIVSPTAPPAPSGRAPKIVDSQGYFKSLRERVIEVIPAAISAASSGDGPRYDLSNFRNQSAILKAYQSRDYTACLDLFNARIKDQPSLLKNPLSLLFKALLYKQLGADQNMQAVLLDLAKLAREEPRAAAAGYTALAMRFILLEALELHSEAQEHATEAIEAARPTLIRAGSQARRGDVLSVVKLYKVRARARILQGDMAGALADERAALELPPGFYEGLSAETSEESLQGHLNTIVMEWELLEQEFPAYADYLEANGWPEPKPDLRNLKAQD
jgi:serine/threonine protein kinase